MTLKHDLVHYPRQHNCHQPVYFSGVTPVTPFIDGFHTVPDSELLAGVRWLYEGDGVLVEPSATAGLTIPWRVGAGTHLVWLTGGALVPEAEREAMLAAARAVN